jgi:hypothetical protein
MCRHGSKYWMEMVFLFNSYVPFSMLSWIAINTLKIYKHNRMFKALKINEAKLALNNKG